MTRPPFALLLLVPAAALAAPLPPEGRASPVPNLEGTLWFGQGPDHPTSYRFEKGGRLSYTYAVAGAQAYRNGHWKQDGRSVYFECNDKFFEFRGTVGGTDLAGRAWNVPGGKWEMRLKRQPDE